MANAMPFAGKWTLATPGGLSITLKDAVGGELDLQTTASSNLNQQLNSYGDPAAKAWLQAANWNYLTYSGTGYFATEARSASLAEFALDAISGNKFRIVQKTSSGDFYFSANGNKLERIPKAGSPPDSTIFIQNVIAPGLAQLKFGAMGRNLRGVYFSGDDLTDFVFSGSDLGFAILQGATTLKSATFQGCKVERTDFRDTDLEGVTMTGIQGESPFFDRVILRESTDLSGAIIPKASFFGAVSTGTTPGTGPTMNTMHAQDSNFNDANLTAAVLNGGHFERSQWINAKLTNAQMGGSHFDEAVMNRADCTGAALQSSFFDGAQLVTVEFVGASITNSSFIGANLTNAKLSKVAGLTGIKLQRAQLIGTILNGLDLTSVGLDSETNMMGAQMEGVNLTERILDGMNFVRANLKNAILDRTSMERAVLVGAVMSFVSATGNVSFVGADLSNSSLEGAKLNGAQMGAKLSLGMLPAGAAKDLNEQRMPSGIHSLLTTRSLTASAAARITMREHGREWIVEDECGEFHLEAKEGGVQVDQLNAVPAAVLSNAFMPNADLTGANLFAVDMSGAHWYGSNASANNANLELINLSNANLATMNFTQARMYGANLSFATVAGTNFTGALLTPTTQLRASSFSFASMQGAVFTAAKIGGSNLTNAAVSLDVNAPVKFVGVPLFPIPTSFAETLDNKKINAAMKDLFVLNGYPLIDKAVVTVDAKGIQWSILNFDASSTTLQTGYSKFILWKRDNNGIAEIAVFGGSPVLVIRRGAGNEQQQGSIAFGPALDLAGAMDDETTTPSGMKLAMQKKDVAYEVLLTAGLPPRPPKCIPSPDRWC